MGGIDQNMIKEMVIAVIKENGSSFLRRPTIMNALQGGGASVKS